MNPNQPVILYAEDEETDSILFQRAFRRASVPQRVVRVLDGRAAKDYLEQARLALPGGPIIPRLVLLDVNMPGISGLELLQWIRSIPLFGAVIIIMLSSSNRPGDIRRAYELGANAYLVKPTDIDDIYALAKTIKDTWLAPSTPEMHDLSPRPPTAQRPKQFVAV